MIAAIVLAVASAALPLCDRSLRSLAVCLGTSFALLAFLHHRSTLTLDEQTALADVVLLTPCVVLVTAAIL
jgi:hypothetical protein